MLNFRCFFIVQLLSAFAFCKSATAQYNNSSIHFTVNDGLPSSTCYDLVQDEKGFLWIATEGGLTKFDGYTFKTYTTSDGLADNEIVNVQKDAKGRLWLNTNGPLTYFENDSFHTIPSENNTNLKWNFKVLDDNNGKLWISRVDGIAAYDSESLKPIEIEKMKDNIGPFYIAGIHDSGIWIANKHMLYKYEGTEIADSIDLGKDKIKIDPNISFFKIKSPHLYYSNRDSLFKYQLDKKNESFLIEIHHQPKQLNIKDSLLWILTRKNLTKLVLSSDDQIKVNEVFVEEELCSKILFDANQNLWTANYKNGLKMFPPSNENTQTNMFENLGSHNLESILIDGERILMGSEVGDLYVIENGTTQHFVCKQIERRLVNRIVDIARLPKSGYLISTDWGIYLFRNNELKHIIQSYCKNIHINGQKVLINTYDKLIQTEVKHLLSIDKVIRFKDDTQNFKNIDNERSYTSIIDRNENVWNANVLAGLYVANSQDTFYFKSLSSVFNCTVSRLIELDNGVICAVTKGEGLILIKGKSFKQINTKNGLSSNYCYDIEANGSKLFIATNLGVNIVDLKNYDRLDFSVKVIDMHNGIPSNEVHDVAYNDNTLYLATNEGMVTYNLNNTNEVKVKQEVYLTAFEVNGDGRPLANDYELKYYENNLKINYITPDIGTSKNSLYAYKMEGVDEDWIHTTSKETHYSNLQSGAHKFFYKLGNDEKDSDAKFINIHIEAAFVNSNYFRLLVLGALCLMFLFPLYLSYNTRQQNTMASLLQKKSSEVEDKMHLLEKTNRSLVASNKELEQFAYIASHDLQEPINTIKGFSDMLKKKFEKTSDDESLKMLNIISNSSSRMKSLVQDLLVYSRIGREKKRSMIDANSMMEDVMRDMTDRIESCGAVVEWDSLPYIAGYEVELRSLFQNLISNAIKFQKPGVPPIIKISAEKRDGAYEFSVKDNGIGIDAEHKERIFEIFQRLHNKDKYEGTGIGLAHCKKIVNLHHGKIWIESELGRGSNFKFTMEI